MGKVSIASDIKFVEAVVKQKNMGYIGIGICVVAVIAVGMILYLKFRKKEEEPSDAAVATVNKTSKEALKNRVFSLVAHVKKIADFQTEILEMMNYVFQG